MRAVLPATSPAGEGVPRLGELAPPEPGPGEVLIRVRAAGLNRADLLQLRGHYPPPAGESPIPGLECAGTVEAVAASATRFRVGDRVMALLAGGGQAEFACAPEGQVLALPENLDFVEGAAIPEALVTAWTNLVAEGGLVAGETVLVSGANGGMGTMTVAVAAALDARVVAAGRDRQRLQPLLALGATDVVALDDQFAVGVLALTGGKGADLAIDFVGGDHFSKLLSALGSRGRLVLVGLMAGRSTPVDLDAVLRKRLRVLGSLLRPRPRTEKSQLVQAAGAFALPLFAAGRLRPLVDREFPFARIDEAYRALAAGGVAGKVIVTLS